MRAVGIIALYLVWVFLGGALLAPWVYQLVLSWSDSSQAVGTLAKYPFHRYVNRCLIFMALTGLWPLIRTLGMNSSDALGLRKPDGKWRDWLRGLGWGFGTLFFAAALAVVLGYRVLNLAHSPSEWLKLAKNASIAALAAGAIEELLFRGCIFGVLRRSSSFSMAAGVSAALYALLHFFQRPQNPEEIAWYSGFIILGRMLGGFIEFQALIPGLLALFLVGLILAWAREVSGAIYLPFGIHAGLILTAKTYPFLTQPSATPNEWIAGSGKLVDGWMCALMLVVLALCFRWAHPGKRSNTA